METISAGTQRSADKISKDLKNAAHQGEELLQSTAADLEDIAKEGHAQLSAAVDAVKAAYATLQDKIVESAKTTDRVVREHPYPSLGVVFGIGLLIGFLCHRRGS